MKKLTAAALAVAVLAATAVLVPAATSASDHRRRERHEAEEHEPEGRRGREGAAPVDPAGHAVYQKECGSCHLAFPPGLLSAASHRRVLAGLDRHFGQNAELDDATRARIEGWLVANAGGRDGGVAPGQAPRITTAPWFARKHRKVDGVAARPSIRTLANCAACHRGAADWDFDEDRVKIPAS